MRRKRNSHPKHDNQEPFDSRVSLAMNSECFCEIVLRKFVRDFHCLGILPESWFAHKIISLLRVRSLPVEVALLRFDRTAEAAVPYVVRGDSQRKAPLLASAARSGAQVLADG
jgi:hypothetical protein